MQTNNLTKKFISLLLTALIIATLSLIVVSAMNVNVTALAEEDYVYYSNDGAFTVDTETFTYSRKEKSTLVKVNNTFPAYYNTNDSLLNSCANVAGANLIGYYDRYYENLIPDCAPGIARGNNYTYYLMTNNLAKRQAVIDDLYIRMGTNTIEPGTDQTGYKNGLTSYVNSKGLSATYASVMTNANLDMSKVHQALSNGKPISLYLSGYNISNVYDMDDGSVTLTKSIFTTNHIMIVYGYQTVDYYNASNALIKSKTYLYVATGSDQVGQYILNNNGTINDAESLQIS